MRVELHPCYVLHGRPYRETSLLLDVFSRLHGRLGLIAKGVRKQRGDKRALLQPGRKINLAWTARRELGTLTQAEAASDERAPVTAALSMFYVNELLVRLLHRNEPHPELFDSYCEAMDNLAEGQGEQAALRVFEKRLLQCLGYGLALETDVDGNPVQPGARYQYLLERGPTPVVAAHCDGIGISGRTLLALAGEDLGVPASHCAIVLGEAKQLMRAALGRLLGDKPLRSRALYRSHLDNMETGKQCSH